MSEYVNCGTVCVVLCPYDDGLILIRRGDPNSEGYGELALPGGFQEGKIAEPVRIAAAREFKEETGLTINPDFLVVRNVETDSYKHNVIFFDYIGRTDHFQDFSQFKTDEITEVVVVKEAVQTAFPFHTTEVGLYFHNKEEPDLSWDDGSW